jgi:hypothetical protein
MDYSSLMKSKPRCVECATVLSGRQRRFCSRACKNRDTNNRHQSYATQQARGLQRKMQLIAEAGGCCTQCGYRRNVAALTWHHNNPALKAFNLDVRSMSNRSQTEVRMEIAKCVLLCANCHAETHFPSLSTDAPPRRTTTTASTAFAARREYTRTRGRGTSAFVPDGSGDAACAVPRPRSGESVRG